MSQAILNITNIPMELIGNRLDKILSQQLPGYSRTYFQDLIDRGLVFVNGKKITKGSYSVQATDQISVTIPPAKEYDLTPTEVAFDVVDENADFLVINKPAGLVVHPSDNNKEEVSLVHGLLHRYPDFCNLKDEQRPGVVHRLDRDTSGLMLIARTERSQRELISMFEKRQMHKTYLAVVARHPHKFGTIEFPIGRHPIHRHKMSHMGIANREATSLYKNLVYYKDSSLVSVNIITGRTHQIRVHMAAIGHGLVGDSLYGYKSRLISRQALHSWNLHFEYRGKKFNYQIPVPQDMKILLQKLKSGENFN